MLTPTRARPFVPSAIQGVEAWAQPDGAAGRVGDGAALDVDEMVVGSAKDVVEVVIVVVDELKVEEVDEDEEEEEELGVD